METVGCYLKLNYYTVECIEELSSMCHKQKIQRIYRGKLYN